MPTSSSRGSGDRSGSCCCSLLSGLLELALTLGGVIFVWWLIFRPHLPRAAVEEVRIDAFNLTDNSTALRYNLSFGLALRNPNRRIGIYYDSLEAAVLYNGTQMESFPLPPFYQHHKNTTSLRAEFGGRAADAGSLAAFYAGEKAQGFYNLEVTLDARVRMKLWFVKLGHFRPKYDCKVRIAVPQNGRMPVTFQHWECER